MSTRILYACIKYSVDLICNVISCCDTGKFNLCDKIVILNQKKETQY